MRQSLLVAIAVLVWHGSSPLGTGLGAASGSWIDGTARELAWSSDSGRESAPSPDAVPLSLVEGKREKTENENDFEASLGLGVALAGSHRLVPPIHARSHAPRERAAALGPPARPARLRC